MANDRYSLSWKEVLCLFSILVVAVALRWYRIGDESAWFDEVSSLQFADAPSLGQFLQTERPDDPTVVPLYFTMEYFVWHLFPHSIVACRLLSIILGIGAILLLYGLGRRLFGPVAALVAAACAAVAMQQVYYSQEIRMYSLFLFSATLSMYSFERLLRSNRNAWWFVYGLSSSMLVWTHLHGLWLLAAQGMVVLFAWRKDFQKIALWSAITVPIVFSFAMWVATIDPVQVNKNLNWIPSANKDAARQISDFFGGADKANNELSSQFPRWDRALGLLLLTLAALVLAWTGLVIGTTLHAVRRNRRDRREESRQFLENIGLMLVWLLVPGLILIVLTIIWKPTFMPRYVLHSSMALYLLMGAGIAAVRSRTWQIVSACVLIGLYAYPTLALPFPRRADMRTVMTAVCAKPPAPGGKVLVYPFVNALAAEFYGPTLVDSIESFKQWEEMPDCALALAKQGHECWIIIGAGNLNEVPPDLGPSLRERSLDYEHQFVLGMFPQRLYRISLKTSQ